ncbi:hypothetical protein O0S10_01735 [Methanocorpusculum sp. MG]|uniref:Uncharacterized protein n=1 Tax=Methanocorpusculum petauri TaxID=3002863 RepID=A0ABT4IDY5_9EURY|nr:hypothetical protein [Methanocorpusculum petauri]MCZ0859948.1 hypothetical protein [Methanocorpusculum petauri]
MPSVANAIVIRASVVPLAARSSQYGVAAVVGLSDADAKNTPREYTQLSTLLTDHGADTPVGTAAKAAFENGIGSLYVVSISAVAADQPTADEVAAALATLLPHVTTHDVAGVCLAGIYSDQPALLKKLAAFAEANKIIFTTTHPAGAEVADIVSAVKQIDSEYGMFVAHADPEFTGDLAAATLGHIMTLHPAYRIGWTAVDVAVTKYFPAADVETLETARVNAVLLLKNDGRNYLSNQLTLTQQSEKSQYLDILRKTQWIVSNLQDDLTTYMLNTPYIRYDDVGFAYIEGRIMATLERLKGDNQVLSSYEIAMPRLADIPAASQRERILTGIQILVKAPGDIQGMVIPLIVEAF